jgi:hypothetical protein
VADGLLLLNRTVHQLGPDLLIAGDPDWAAHGRAERDLVERAGDFQHPLRR